MELEEEELALFEGAEMGLSARLPEVDLIAIASTGEELKPIAVGHANKGLHSESTWKAPLEAATIFPAALSAAGAWPSCAARRKRTCEVLTGTMEAPVARTCSLSARRRM